MDRRCGFSAYVVFPEARLASIASAHGSSSRRPVRRGEQECEITAWLSRNPRITLHFTPTSGSWLNMVGVFFGIITRPAIRRGSLDSVGQLTAAIRAFFEGWNDRGDRFTWAKTAGEIMPYATRERDSDARH